MTYLVAGSIIYFSQVGVESEVNIRTLNFIFNASLSHLDAFPLHIPLHLSLCYNNLSLDILNDI